MSARVIGSFVLVLAVLALSYWIARDDPAPPEPAVAPAPAAPERPAAAIDGIDVEPGSIEALVTTAEPPRGLFALVPLDAGPTGLEASWTEQLPAARTTVTEAGLRLREEPWIYVEGPVGEASTIVAAFPLDRGSAPSAEASLGFKVLEFETADGMGLVADRVADWSQALRKVDRALRQVAELDRSPTEGPLFVRFEPTKDGDSRARAILALPDSD